MYISLKNLGLLLLLLGSLAGVGLSIWWLVGEGGREPVVALVAAIVGVGGTAYGIDWQNLFVSDTEHDAAIFRTGDELLPEGTIQLIVEDVTTGHYRSSRELEMCDSFHFFCNEEGNAFLSKGLQTSRSRFNAALDALGKYTAVNFFPVANHRYKLYPELSNELDFGKPEDFARYEGYRQELQRLSEEVSNSYKDYRQLVKRRLKT
jgi:hypothetical protein